MLEVENLCPLRFRKFEQVSVLQFCKPEFYYVASSKTLQVRSFSAFDAESIAALADQLQVGFKSVGRNEDYWRYCTPCWRMTSSRRSPGDVQLEPGRIAIRS